MSPTSASRPASRASRTDLLPVEGDRRSRWLHAASRRQDFSFLRGGRRRILTFLRWRARRMARITRHPRPGQTLRGAAFSAAVLIVLPARAEEPAKEPVVTVTLPAPSRARAML